MERSSYINSKGEEFSYLKNKTKKGSLNFVFFHATGFNAQTYTILLDKLNNKFNSEINIYALDQRGHGLSKAEAVPENLTSWAPFLEDGLEFVDSLSGPIICSGHSMGAVIAAKVASKRKNKQIKLFMIEPVLFGPEQAKIWRASQAKPGNKPNIADGAAKRRRHFDSIEEALKSYEGRGAFKTWGSEWIKDYLIGGTQKSSNEGIELSCTPEWESMTFKSSSMDTWDFLEDIEIQTFTIAAAPEENSGTTFSEDARKALLGLGSAWELEEIEGASHFLPMEYSDLVADRIYVYSNI
ncbi:alpha/beta hydrolase [Gammaproteobacteria bacterium]|nr:alpha/beta hydrolase [Gammaproteobacteria bacterium]